MPRQTDRQQETNAVLDALIVQMITEAEIATYCDHSDSDSSSASGSESDTLSTSSSMEVDDGVTDVLLESLAELYCTRYQDDRRNIPKTVTNMHNLLDVYKI